MRFFIAAYPWDVLDEGIDDVLDQLRGTLGVTGLALHVACPAVTQFRTRDVEPRVFRSRGGFFFKPSPERYGATRCKPIAASHAGRGDPLAAIADACRSRDLELRTVISAATTGRLAERYPEMACKNAYGDPSRRSLCLSNPDVQAYLVDLIADVSARPGATGVCLVDYMIAWCEAYLSELEVPGGFSETDRALLSICFCESCRQRAAENDIDSAAAQRAVQVAIEQSVNGERGGKLDFAALCEKTDLLARYVDQRPTILAAMLDRLADVCTVDLLVRVSRVGPMRDQHLDRLPHDRTRAMFEIAFEMAAGSDAVSALPPGVGELSLRSAFHDKTDAPKLVGLVTTAAESGVRGVTFEHLGLWNDTALTAIKQAVRFARRTTTA